MQPVASATQSPFFSLLSQIQNALTVGKASGVQTGLGVNGADKASGLLSFPSPLGSAPPLDLAQQALKAGLLAVTLSNDFTRGLDFDAEFNSAFKPSSFSNPPTLQNPLGLAQGAVNLATGIFNKTSASKTMSAAERATLFLMLMNGANMGLKGAAGLLQQAGALTGEVKQALNRLRATIQLDLQNFYGGARSTTFASSSPTPTTFSNPVSTAAAPVETATPELAPGAPAEQPAAPAETPIPVTGIGPLASAPVEAPPIESQPVAVETEPAIAEAGPAAPETETAPPAAPAETPHPILSDPGVQALLEDIKNNRQRFPVSSGTYNDGRIGYYLTNFETPDGVDHSLLDIYVYSSDGNGAEYILVDDGSVVFERRRDEANGGYVNDLGELYSKLDAQPLLTAENPAGQTFQIQSLFENGKVDRVEVNGAAMTSAELVRFVQDNGFETRSVGSNVTEYIANSKTPLGDKPIVIAAEVSGVAMNRQQYLYENNPIATAYWYKNQFASFVKDQKGQSVFVEHKDTIAGLEMEKEFRVNGREMTADEFLNFADANLNFRKVSYEDQGKQVELYIGEETVAGGVQSIIVGKRIDGQAVEGAFSRGDVSYESLWGLDYPYKPKISYHDDPFELIANQEGRTFEYGEIHARDEFGRTTDLITLVNGEEMTDGELLDFAKNNNFKSVAETTDGSTRTHYFSSGEKLGNMYGRLRWFGETPFASELNDVAHDRLGFEQAAKERDLAFAKENGYMPLTFTMDGRQFTQYYDGNRMAFVAEIDGKAVDPIQTQFEDRKVVNGNGETFKFTRATAIVGEFKGANAYLINDDYISDPQLLNFAREQNIDSFTYQLNGRQITSYFNVDGQHFISDVDGAVLNDSQLYAGREIWSVVNESGQSFQLPSIKLMGSGLYGDVTFANGVQMDKQQLLNFAKENNIASLSYEIDGKQITSYFDVTQT